MTIELPSELEVAIKGVADARGISPDRYVLEVLERNLINSPPPDTAQVPFTSGFGMLAKYGSAPTDAEMAENRADMLRNFGEGF